MLIIDKSYYKINNQTNRNLIIKLTKLQIIKKLKVAIQKFKN